MRFLRAFFWWGITLVTLIILDDMVFGPIFWALATYNRLLSTIVAFFASWAFGLWLVNAGLKDEPSKLANFFLSHLMLGHKTKQIHEREEKISRTAATGTGALLVTPVIGGVIPALILRKYELMKLDTIRSYAVLLTAVYAVEFAAIHGWGVNSLFTSIF